MYTRVCVCVLLVDVESPDAEFYDLVSNPERYTGYTGQSAVNIWRLIYDQNCFKYVADTSLCEWQQRRQ